MAETRFGPRQPDIRVLLLSMMLGCFFKMEEVLRTLRLREK